MNDSRQPELAEPGAGIPTPERWIGNLGVRIFAARASKDRITRLFAEEAKRAVDLARELSVEQSRRRVLIDRFPGIEDSSRHWSVFMTLEHLVIANTIVADLVQRLCAGRETERTVHIRDLKPNPDAGPELVGELESLVARYGEIVSSHGELLTAKRHPHPWFGSLTARQWHALAALHNRIHRTQIERIVKVLRQGPSP
jgi:hypothetical protein